MTQHFERVFQNMNILKAKHHVHVISQEFGISPRVLMSLNVSPQVVKSLNVLGLLYNYAIIILIIFERVIKFDINVFFNSALDISLRLHRLFDSHCNDEDYGDGINKQFFISEFDTELGSSHMSCLCSKLHI